MGIPDATVKDVLQCEVGRYPKLSDALRSARAILHTITATYLDETDYAKSEALLLDAIKSKDEKTIQSFCRSILTRHDSTRERLPYLEDFYHRILEICPTPSTILDLACGLNPFAFPFMGLPRSVRYHAYDIHQPRVTLINQFFHGMGLAPLAEVCDILVTPPKFKADAAFLFKEVHRMEKRRKGSIRELVKALNARVIFISLPNCSLDRQRDLRPRMNALFTAISEGLEGTRDCADFPGETLYWIKRSNG